MQSDKERFKVAAYYYDKAAEVGLDNAGRLVQFYTDVEGDWQDGINSSMMTGEVGFHPAYTWRIKPETVMHKGGEYPKPLTVEELDCKEYGCVYLPSHQNDDMTYACYGKNIHFVKYVRMGIAHSTKEAAIAHAKVIYQIED